MEAEKLDYLEIEAGLHADQLLHGCCHCPPMLNGYQYSYPDDPHEVAALESDAALFLAEYWNIGRPDVHPAEYIDEAKEMYPDMIKALSCYLVDMEADETIDDRWKLLTRACNYWEFVLGYGK